MNIFGSVTCFSQLFNPCACRELLRLLQKLRLRENGEGCALGGPQVVEGAMEAIEKSAALCAK